MTHADRQTAGVDAEKVKPAGDARADPAPAGMLRLQGLAGNQAVAGLVQRLEQGEGAPRGEGHRDAHYHGIPRLVEFFLTSHRAPYTLQMCSMVDGPIGHAWVGFKAGDGSVRTVGFWPASVLGLVVGAGELRSDDTHAGQQTQLHERQVSEKEASRALDVLADFDDSPYSLAARNCADFAVHVWRAVTGESLFPEHYKDDAHFFWNPLAIGKGIDERNRLVAQARGDSGFVGGGGGGFEGHGGGGDF
jgi:hypothetical protein